MAGMLSLNHWRPLAAAALAAELLGCDMTDLGLTEFNEVADSRSPAQIIDDSAARAQSWVGGEVKASRVVRALSAPEFLGRLKSTLEGATIEHRGPAIVLRETEYLPTDDFSIHRSWRLTLAAKKIEYQTSYSHGLGGSGSTTYVFTPPSPGPLSEGPVAR